MNNKSKSASSSPTSTTAVGTVYGSLDDLTFPASSSSTSAPVKPVGTVYSTLDEMQPRRMLPRSVSKRGDCTPTELEVLQGIASLLGIHNIDSKIKPIKLIWDIAQQEGKYLGGFHKFLSDLKAKIQGIIERASAGDIAKIKSFFADNMIFNQAQANALHAVVFKSEQLIKNVEKGKLTLEQLNDIAAKIPSQMNSQGRGF